VEMLEIESGEILGHGKEVRDITSHMMPYLNIQHFHKLILNNLTFL